MRMAAILFARCRGHASCPWRAVARPAEKLLVAESVIEKSVNPRDISAGKSLVGVCIAMLRTFRNAAQKRLPQIFFCVLRRHGASAGHSVKRLRAQAMQNDCAGTRRSPRSSGIAISDTEMMALLHAP